MAGVLDDLDGDGKRGGGLDAVGRSRRPEVVGVGLAEARDVVEGDEGGVARGPVDGEEEQGGLGVWKSESVSESESDCEVSEEEEKNEFIVLTEWSV